jgi:hypothetical protein
MRVLAKLRHLYDLCDCLWCIFNLGDENCTGTRHTTLGREAALRRRRRRRRGPPLSAVFTHFPLRARMKRRPEWKRELRAGVTKLSAWWGSVACIPGGKKQQRGERYSSRAIQRQAITLTKKLTTDPPLSHGNLVLLA